MQFKPGLKARPVGRAFYFAATAQQCFILNKRYCAGAVTVADEAKQNEARMSR